MGFRSRAPSGNSKLEHACRWCRRRPAIASLLGVLALTVASSLLGLLTLWRHSETERSRAENALVHAIASDKATSGAVRDLVGLLASTVEAPQMLANERLVESSRAVRALTAKLRQDPRVAASNLVAICGLEYLLADDLDRRGKHAESQALLTDSLELLEGRRRLADDPDVDEAYSRSLMLLGYIAGRRARYDDMLGFYQRAEATLERLTHDARKLDVLLSIDEARREIVWVLGQKGLEEPRRKLMESHVRMFEQMCEQSGGEHAIGLLAKMARSDLALDRSGSAKLRNRPHRFAAHKPVTERFEWKVADWIAEDIQSDEPHPNADGEPGDRLDPVAHAHAIILAIESRCKGLGIYPALVPAAAFQVAGFAHDRGAEQRKAGCLEEARRTAACLSAFATLLAKRDPKEPLYHLLLCVAFEQESKNAWKIHDYTAIEGALRKALGEASTALRLDPRNTDARLLVSGLQDKLIGLASHRP